MERAGERNLPGKVSVALVPPHVAFGTRVVLWPGPQHSHEFPKGLSNPGGTQPWSLCHLGPEHRVMHLHGNLRQFCVVVVEAMEAAAHDRPRTTNFIRSFSAAAYPVGSASLRTKPVKLCSMHCYIFGFTCLSFGRCVSRGIPGAVTTHPHANPLGLQLPACTCP